MEGYLIFLALLYIAYVLEKICEVIRNLEK